jgi:hypothetical protein
MKKKHLLLILLMALLAPWAAKAQGTLFSEDFEGGSMPTGWTTDGPGSWSVGIGDYSSGTGAGHGSYNAKITHSTSNSVTKLITPEIDLSSATSAELSFMHVQRSWSGDIDQLRVYYRTSSSGAWTLLDGQTYTGAVASWTTEENIALPNISSTYQIAFEMTDKYGYGVGIDYVQIVQGASCAKPTGLAATLTPGDGTIATLSWTKGGEETDWVLEYSTSSTFASDVTTYDGSFTTEGTTVSADLMMLTPETTYYARVKADCGGEQSDWSTVCTFQPTSKTVIGSGDATSNYLPTYTNWKYSLTQQIYTTSELGAAGVIESIDFYSTSTAITRNLDIYIVSTTKSSFESGTDWITVTSADKVFSGSVTFSPNAWNTITLDSDFIYDGLNNIAIIVDDNSGEYPSTQSFRVFNAANQAIYVYSDNTNYDPTNPGSYSGTKASVKNQIRILKSDLPTCFKPTALAYSEVGSRQAKLSWTKNGDETAWQICVNGDEAHPVAANANPFVLTGLEPSTPYTVKVRAYCDAEDQSDWSSPVTFTTLEACPTPTALSVSEITANSAKISWTSDNDNFDMRYATIAGKGRATFEYDFEDGSLGDWTTIDADGDGFDWFIPDYGTATGHNDSDYLATSESYDSNSGDPLTPDNYLVSKRIALGGSISFWAAGQDEDYPEEHFGVAVSIASNNDANDFTTIDEWTIPLAKGSGTKTGRTRGGNRDVGTYYEYEVDLSAYAGLEGYVAIRHFNSTDQFRLNIDDITLVEGDGGGIVWTTVEDVTNPYVFPGNLTKETNYVVQVRSNCGGDDGSSNWSASANFTTLPTCLKPTGLAVSEVTATTAKLSWTENGEATAWQICLNDDLVHLVDADSNPFTLTGLTSETAYTAKVRAYCDSEDQSAWSDAVNFTPSAYTNYTYRDGASSTNGNIPINGYGAINLIKSQLIIPAANLPIELVDGRVRRLTYYTTTSTADWGAAIFKVYVAEVENTSFATAAFIDWTELNEVYCGSLSVVDSKLTINLDSEFTYNGGNLLIGFDMTTPGSNKGIFWTSSYSGYYGGVYQYGDNDPSRSSYDPKITFNYLPTSTPRPTSLQTKEVLSSEATLAWIAPTADGVTGYEYSYKLSTSEVWSSDEVNDTIVNITGLTAEKTYDFRVRAKYGAQYSQYVTIQFETPASCPVPTGLAATNLSQISADLSWTASVEVDDYTVQYRTAAYVDGLSEEFSTSLPTNWSMYKGLFDEELGTATLTSLSYAWSFGTNNGVFDNHARVNIYDDNQRWLVTPKFNVTSNTLTFDMALTAYSGASVPAPATDGTDDKFMVLVSTDDMATWTVLRKWDNAGSTYVYNDIANTAVGELISIDITSYNGQNVNIAFYGESTVSNADNNLHIDNVFCGTNVPEGTWASATTTAPNTGVYTITGLTAGTKYDVRVYANCCSDPETENDMVTFTTLAEHNIVFPEDGTWSAGNFEPTGAPGIDDDIIIRADVNIPDGTNAQANNINLENGAVITVANGATLTINGNVTNGGNDKIIVEDGGQVIVSNSGIRATLKKSVSNTAKDTKPTWYTISTPVSITYASSVINLISSTDPGFNYDLYYYQETTRLWKNYKNSSFYINNGKGYLYWNSTGSELAFPGLMNYGNVNVTLTKTAAEPADALAGFNLIGNPYPHNIYKGAGTAIENSVAEGYELATGFYTLSNSGEWVAGTDNTTAIKPAQGILVQATTAGTLTIKDKTESAAKANNDNIKFSVANNQFEDVTYALFMDEIGLTKINHRNDQAPMIYITQDGENYAIATMGDDTETFGLNFKAMTTGMYTLSAKADGMFSYLHVIDRLTGEDIDMLVDGKYEFIGSPRDNEARFIVKLRYNANGFDNDEFIYQNGDELIVNGEGELQVYDVMGRYVASYNVNGNKRISAEQFSNAVYIFRLIGSDVKTQKIVVR